MKKETPLSETVTFTQGLETVLKDTVAFDSKQKAFFALAFSDLKKHNANTQTLSARFTEMKAEIKAKKANDGHKQQVSRMVSIAYDYIAFELVSKFDALQFVTIEKAVKLSKALTTLSRAGLDHKGAIGAELLKKYAKDKTVTLVSYTDALKDLKKDIADVAKRPEFQAKMDTTDYNNAIIAVISAVSHAFKIVENEEGVLISIENNIKKAVADAKLTNSELIELQKFISATIEANTAKPAKAEKQPA